MCEQIHQPLLKARVVSLEPNRDPDVIVVPRDMWLLNGLGISPAARNVRKQPAMIPDVP
jgi:hypothetical protein